MLVDKSSTRIPNNLGLGPLQERGFSGRLLLCSTRDHFNICHLQIENSCHSTFRRSEPMLEGNGLASDARASPWTAVPSRVWTGEPISDMSTLMYILSMFSQIFKPHRLHYVESCTKNKRKIQGDIWDEIK